MKGWVGLTGWPIADGLPTLVVTHQLQVERRTGEVRRPETDVLPLCHATNLVCMYVWIKAKTTRQQCSASYLLRMYRHLSIVGHLQLRRILGALSQPTPASSDHRHKKTFFTFFLFWSRFNVFNAFYFPNVIYLKKKTLAKFTAASRLTRSTFRITATKWTYDFYVACRMTCNASL